MILERILAFWHQNFENRDLKTLIQNLKSGSENPFQILKSGPENP